MAIARCACAFRSQMLIDSVDKWAVNCGQEHTPFYLQRPQPPPNLLNSSNTQHWPDTPSSSFFCLFWQCQWHSPLICLVPSSVTHFSIAAQHQSVLSVLSSSSNNTNSYRNCCVLSVALRSSCTTTFLLPYKSVLSRHQTHTHLHTG